MAQEGETLEGIASAYAIDTETLQGLNPGIGSQPPAGTSIKVPLPAGKQVNPSTPPVAAGGAPIQLPNSPMLQIASDRSPGQPIGKGPFLLEPFGSGVPPLAPSH